MKYKQVLGEHKKEVDLLNNILSLGLTPIHGQTAAQKKKNHSFNVYFLEYYVADSVMAAPIFYDEFCISRALTVLIFLSA